MRRLFFIFLIICSRNASSQDFTKDYIPLRSTGDLPEAFTANGQVKTKANIDHLQENNSKVKKTKEEFVLKSTFVLDHLLKSGRVLLNDPVSKYVNKVTDSLLAKDPVLRSQIHVYVNRSSVVNAYTFDNGEIFINLGLIAQLENEAELAYVIAHEIIHFREKHSMNSYVDFVKIDKSDYSLNSDERDLIKSTYSKENEKEADEKGFEIYEKTNYTNSAVMGMFDVLSYSYLPIDDEPFKKGFLETQDLVFPKSYFLDSTQKIKENEDYDDSKSTHPNIRKRRDDLNELMKHSTKTGGKEFIVSEKEFLDARLITRFELCRLYLVSADYENALYTSYILLKKYPENKFLKRTVVKSLYALSLFKAGYFYGNGAENQESLIPSYSKIEGCSQEVYYLMNKLSGLELSSTALSYAWSVKMNSSNDPVLNDICDSLFSLLATRYNVTPFSYYDKNRTEKKESGSQLKDTAESQDKSAKIRVQANESGEDPDFIKYAFVEWIKKDTAFIGHFERALKHKKQTSNSFDDSFDYSSIPSKKELRKLKKGVSLGIDKVVIVAPNFVEADEHNADSYKYIGTDKKRIQLTNILTSSANTLHLDYALLDPQSFEKGDINKFNDFSIINNWVIERMQHGEENKCLVLSTDEGKRLVKDYGTKYFLWSGVISVRVVKQMWRLGLILPVYTIPYVIYYFARPEYKVLYYSLLIDVESGEIKMFNAKIFEERDAKDMLTSNTYEALNQIKRKPK